MKKKKAKTEAREGVSQALSRLTALLQDADVDQNGSISRQEFRAVLTKHVNALSDDDVKLLFECENDPDVIFDVIDKDRDEKIEYVEVIQQASKRGVDLIQIMRGYERIEITGITNLLTILAETLLLNVKRITARSSDFSRTIGINTKYLDSFDWNMERADKNFLIQRGKQATLCFLREYIATQSPPRKSTQEPDGINAAQANPSKVDENLTEINV